MKCLVTGASGFVGSYLVEYLTKEGHQVTAVGRVPNRDRRQRWIDTSSRQTYLIERVSLV